jgi:hypothetical protein
LRSPLGGAGPRKLDLELADTSLERLNIGPRLFRQGPVVT